MPVQKEKSQILDSADSSTRSVLVGCPPESFNALTSLQQPETPQSQQPPSSLPLYLAAVNTTTTAAAPATNTAAARQNGNDHVTSGHCIESSCEILSGNRSVDDASDPSATVNHDSQLSVMSNGQEPLQQTQQEQHSVRQVQQQLQQQQQQHQQDLHHRKDTGDDIIMQDTAGIPLANAKLDKNLQSTQNQSHDDMSHTKASDVVMSDVHVQNPNCEDDSIVSVHKTTLTGAPATVELKSSSTASSVCYTSTSRSPASCLVDRLFNTRVRFNGSQKKSLHICIFY